MPNRLGSNEPRIPAPSTTATRNTTAPAAPAAPTTSAPTTWGSGTRSVSDSFNTTRANGAPQTAAAGLKPGAKGEAVKEAQKQLIRAGFELPRYGADGDFGGETTKAVKQFQASARLPITGELDVGTLQALKDAKPAAAVQYPEYDKMFSDGVLSSTIAIGYDEDGNDLAQRHEVVQGLVDRGFEPLDVAGMDDAALKKKGLDPATIDKSATYYLKSFEHDGKPVQSLVKLVDRNVDGPKSQFASSMKQDDLVIYSGHARYGSGPDFDDIHSGKQNFVIGQAYEAGHVTHGANDLAKTKLGDKYQLMFFDGCSTKHYVDDLRRLPRNKTADNLDIVASNRPISWSTGTSDVFAMLDGVMQKKSMQDIKGSLDRANAEPNQGPAFLADGFKGNSYRPAQ